MAEPRVLVSWHHPDGAQFPPPRFLHSQINCAPTDAATAGGFVDVTTPMGRYDLADVLARAGIDPAFDLILVFSVSMFNHPTGLSAFDCPKILCLVDTHHHYYRTDEPGYAGGPILPMLEYGREEPFDAVVSICDRQHLHWFAAALDLPVAWFPGLAHRFVAPAAAGTRKPQLAFFGAMMAQMHSRRVRMLERIQEEGLPLVGGNGASRRQIADGCAASAIGFNCSLNGDINTRLFEIANAGAAIVTDRPSPESGLEQLFEPGGECVLYDHADGMCDALRRLLADPAEAAAIGERAQARYMAEHRPESRFRALLDFALRGSLDAPHSVDMSARLRRPVTKERVIVYEALQSRHKDLEAMSILFTADCDPAMIADAGDLVRARVTAPATAANHVAAVARAANAEAAPPEAIAARSWDFAIAPTAAAFQGPDAVRAAVPIIYDDARGDFTAAGYKPERSETALMRKWR